MKVIVNKEVVFIERSEGTGVGTSVDKADGDGVGLSEGFVDGAIVGSSVGAVVFFTVRPHRLAYNTFFIKL